MSSSIVPQDEENVDEKLVSTFLLGGALFGMEAVLIQEVVIPGEITVVHHAPNFVVGIRNLRGRIVTVLDLACRLDLGSVAPATENRILIVEWQDEPIGLLVDSVTDTFEVNKDSILEPPTNLHGVQNHHLQGVCRNGERIVALLNLDAVMKSSENDIASSNKQE